MGSIEFVLLELPIRRLLVNLPTAQGFVREVLSLFLSERPIPLLQRGLLHALGKQILQGFRRPTRRETSTEIETCHHRSVQIKRGAVGSPHGDRLNAPRFVHAPR
jgi:hypothetical protein